MEDLRAELERVDANAHQAPVNIKMADTLPLTVADLEFQSYGNTPTKMKLSNTGYTVTLSGKYDGDPPSISGGPLEGSYKFSQLHFHWGPSDAEGGEHTFEGRSVPLEMHAVHVNRKYATQEEALVQKDGVVIVAFLFISGASNPGLTGITRGLPEINKPHTSFKIPPQPLQALCIPFQRDYFSYWGSVLSPSCSHLIQWLVCRDPVQASSDQFAAFRQLLNVNEEPLLRNYRDPQGLQGRAVFHLSPGSRDGFALNCSPDQTSAPVEGAGLEATVAPGADTSVLSVEQPCTSLGEAESKAAVSLGDAGAPVQRTDSGRELEATPSGRLRTPSGHLVERTPSGRLVERTPSGRPVERTPSGRPVERTPSGRPVERTPSGRPVERTPSGRLVERTPSGRLVERTPSGRLVERTPSGRPVETTPSGRLVERTPSERLVERTPSGRLVERTPSGRLVERTPSGHLVEKTPSGRLMQQTPSGNWQDMSLTEGPVVELSPSGHELARTPSGRLIQRTSSGRELERTHSGGFVEVPAPQLLDTSSAEGMKEEAGAAEAAGSERPVQSTPSGRLPSMGSRVVSFSKLTGPIKTLSAGEWPVGAFEGPHTASPVFLDANQAARLPCPPLEFLGHFKTGVGLVLTNSGETVEISLLKATERPVLQGGPLQGRYILDSAHFHWLPNDNATGGTHTINNARSEIECHLVHIHENYKSKTEAMDHPNGLAVVSILHQVGGTECDVFQRICKELPRIGELYTQVELPGLDLSYMAGIAKPHEYFLYPGRFFGRDDGKPLVWIVYSQPIGICCQNVAAFQSLRLSLDFRQHDTYPIGERPLFAVIPDDKVGASAGEGGGEEEEDVRVGELRRTASGRVAAISADEWPNVPFESKHPILMAPVDIQSSTVPSVPMPPLEFRGHFNPSSVPVEIRNTGEAVDLAWLDEGSVPSLFGGPLTDEYIFDSAHFHWAQNPEDVGGMHRINGKRCDLEFHMVHYKKSLKTRQDAMFVSDGLAVTSFLIQVGGQENESFAQLTNALPNVKEVDASVELSVKMDWLQHRAGPHGFFTYPGTLFGADQGINVIWIVYPTPVQICCQHIASFYKLDCRNYDKVHPLHEILDRPMFHSINPDNCTS